MEKVPQSELYIFRAAELDGKILHELLVFNRKYQDRILRYSARLANIISLISEAGYSPAGVMYKNIGLLTKQGIYDRTGADGTRYKTAPWWNVRECCAASMKIFQLAGGQSCFDAYRKAQNATYLNYPNEKIGGLMIQTLDAETLKPLPFNPATGNLDPMHCARAREREIEALEEME